MSWLITSLSYVSLYTSVPLAIRLICIHLPLVGMLVMGRLTVNRALERHKFKKCGLREDPI